MFMNAATVTLVSFTIVHGLRLFSALHRRSWCIVDLQPPTCVVCGRDVSYSQNWSSWLLEGK